MRAECDIRRSIYACRNGKAIARVGVFRMGCQIGGGSTIPAALFAHVEKDTIDGRRRAIAHIRRHGIRRIGTFPPLTSVFKS